TERPTGSYPLMQRFPRRLGSGGGRTVGVAGAAVRLDGQISHRGRRVASYRKMPARRERSTQYSRPASGGLRSTNARGSSERLTSYGDLAWQRLWRRMVSWLLEKRWPTKWSLCAPRSRIGGVSACR